MNKENEVAWLVLGLAQLRLGQDQEGLQSLKGEITLLRNASVAGYRRVDDEGNFQRIDNAERRRQDRR